MYKPLTSLKSDIWNTRLYTGREYDREIGLYYLRARYYDPNLARFTSRDPIGMKDNVNLYTYVANSPMMYTDRMGLEKLIILTMDTDGIIPIFDENGNIVNPDKSYVRNIYNNIDNHQKYERRIINDFQWLDDAINEKNWSEIILIWHGSQTRVSLSHENFFNINDLNSDKQTESQTNILKSTAFIIFGCNTWNDPLFWDSIAQNIQNHYWFKETSAPDNFIWWNGEIANISYLNWELEKKPWDTKWSFVKFTSNN